MNEYMLLLGFHFQIVFQTLFLPLQADPLIRGEGPIKKRFALSAPRQTPLLPSSSLGIENGRVGLSEGDDAPAASLRGKSDINFKAMCEHVVGPLLKHV